MDFIEQLRTNHNIILNPQQEQAVMKIEGATLLLAVPGSGKTTVIISRLGNMIFNHKIEPEKILNVTFSVASASDMKDRFISLFGNEFEDRIEFRTIHSFCKRVVERYIKYIKETEGREIPMPELEKDDKSTLRRVFKELYKKNPKEDIISDIYDKISLAKNMMLSRDQIKEIKIADYDLHEIFEAYSDRMNKNNLMSYDDQLVFTRGLFVNYPDFLNIIQDQYEYINLDEAQDTSLIQLEIVRLLAQKYGNVFMVGDEDQSIYGFRAVDPKYLLNFHNVFKDATVLKLERNYRSTKKIVHSANHFIKQNHNRAEKQMYSENAEGTDIKFISVKTYAQQFDYILDLIRKAEHEKTIAILYRNNESVVALANALMDKDIEFSTREYATTFIDHFIVKEVFSFVLLASNSSNIAAFERIYSKLGLDISKKEFYYVRKYLKGSVFDTLLRYPGLNAQVKSRVRDLQTNFRILKALNPVDAINFIENELGYLKQLQRMAKNRFSLDTLLRKLEIMRVIASKVNDFDQLYQRLVLNRLRLEYVGRNDSNVTLSTLHSSKGLEFDIVILIDAVDGRFPTYESITQKEKGDSSAIEEEVRLFYVGITRAKEEFIVINVKSTYGKPVSTSRFVNYLRGDTLEQSAKFDSNGSSNVENVYDDSERSLYIQKELRKYRVNIEFSHKDFGPGIIQKRVGNNIGVLLYRNRDTKSLDLLQCIQKGLIKIID